MILTPGQIFCFTRTVSNTHPTTSADDVEMVLTLPAGFVIDSTVTSTGSFSVLTWTVGTLLPLQEETIEICLIYEGDCPTEFEMTSTISTSTSGDDLGDNVWVDQIEETQTCCDIRSCITLVDGVGDPIPGSGSINDPWVISGAAGPQGPQGVQGSTGPQGTQGLAGPQGTQGDAGPQGTQGSTGPQGAQGTTGAQGAAGPQGVQGSTGPQGLSGPQGAQGAAGPQGVQGATGPQGTQGLTGPQGAAGPQGVQGSTGSQGTQGLTGPQGPQGVQGTPSPVSSVFSRTGAVVAANGDYTASNITNVPAGTISSVTVQAALNELDGDLSTQTTRVSNLITLSGVAANATNLGTFTGTTIPDNQTEKQALQALETSVETKASATNVTNLVTLSGVAVDSTSLGTFTGTTIPDNQTNKQALQALETSVETKASATHVTNLVTLSGVAVNAASLGAFTGSTIPDSQTVKQAIQSLETAYESSQYVIHYVNTAYNLALFQLPTSKHHLILVETSATPLAIVLPPSVEGLNLTIKHIGTDSVLIYTNGGEYIDDVMSDTIPVTLAISGDVARYVGLGPSNDLRTEGTWLIV